MIEVSPYRPKRLMPDTPVKIPPKDLEQLTDEQLQNDVQALDFENFTDAELGDFPSGSRVLIQDGDVVWRPYLVVRAVE